MVQLSSGIFGKLTVIRRSGEDGNYFPLNSLATTLGRDSDCDIQLRFLEVSRLHSKITFDESTKEGFIQDCSSNGTSLNGTPLVESQRIALKDKDMITIGEREFRFEYADVDSAKKLTEAHAKTDPSSESSISAGLTAIRRLTRSPSAQNSLETPKKKKTSSLKSPVAPQSGKKSLFQNVLKSNLQKALMQEQQQQQQMEEQGEEQQMESEEVAPMESPRKKMVASPKVSSPASRQASPAKAIVPLTTRPLASSSPSKTPLSPAKRTMTPKALPKMAVPSSVPRLSALLQMENPLRVAQSLQNSPKSKMMSPKKPLNTPKVLTATVNAMAVSPIGLVGSPSNNKAVASPTLTPVKTMESKTATPSSTKSKRPAPMDCQPESPRTVKTPKINGSREPSVPSTVDRKLLDMPKDAFFAQVKSFVSKSNPRSAAASVKTVSVLEEEDSHAKLSADEMTDESKASCTSMSSESTRKVTFGPPLEPQVFDTLHPPSSPLLRGQQAPSGSVSQVSTPGSVRSILKATVTRKGSVTPQVLASPAVSVKVSVSRNFNAVTPQMIVQQGQVASSPLASPSYRKCATTGKVMRAQTMYDRPHASSPIQQGKLSRRSLRGVVDEDAQSPVLGMSPRKLRRMGQSTQDSLANENYVVDAVEEMQMTLENEASGCDTEAVQDMSVSVSADMEQPDLSADFGVPDASESMQEEVDIQSELTENADQEWTVLPPSSAKIPQETPRPIHSLTDYESTQKAIQTPKKHVDHVDVMETVAFGSPKLVDEDQRHIEEEEMEEELGNDSACDNLSAVHVSHGGSPSFAAEKVSKTPKDLSRGNVSYVGIREMTKTPKPSTSEISFYGLKEMVKTPKAIPESSFYGLREMVQTPKVHPDVSFKGLRELVNTPKIKAPVESNFEPTIFVENVASPAPIAAVTESAEEEEVIVKKTRGGKRGKKVDEVIEVPSSALKISPTVAELPETPKIATSQTPVAPIPSGSFYGTSNQPKLPRGLRLPVPKNKVLVEKNSDVAPESKAVEQENEPEHFSPAKSQSVRKALATKRSTRAKKQTEEINENEVEAVAEPTPMTTTSTTRSGRGRKKASDKVLEEKATENTSNVEEQDVVVSKRKKRGVNAVVVQDTENVALSKENAVPESELAPTPTLKKRALPVAKKITRQTAALEPTLEDGHSDEEGATTGRRLRSLRKRV